MSQARGTDLVRNCPESGTVVVMSNCKVFRAARKATSVTNVQRAGALATGTTQKPVVSSE